MTGSLLSLNKTPRVSLSGFRFMRCLELVVGLRLRRLNGDPSQLRSAFGRVNALGFEVQDCPQLDCLQKRRLLMASSRLSHRLYLSPEELWGGYLQREPSEEAR